MALPEIEPHARCKNLLWEISVHERRPAPGRYCRNRLGVVQSLDCPVFQGGVCCLFAPRDEGEEPEAADEETILAVRTELAEDHLRWPYRRRVQMLRGELPEEAPARMEVEPEPEEPEDDEDDEAEVVRAELPPEEEVAFKEKYPGQRRSEDRLRSKRPPSADGAEDPFTAGIFEETPTPAPEKKPALEQPEERPGEKPDEKKPDEKKPDEKKPDEKKPDEKKPDEKKPDEKKPEGKGGSRRRRRRRARGRRRGKKGGGQSSA